jgi:uracil phosphoribosyltransferase
MKVNVLDTPMILDELTRIRDERTGGIAFRKGLMHIGRYFGYEITKSLSYSEKEVNTPFGKASGIEIKDMKNILIVNVLRAAIPLVDGLLKVFPEARVGIVSAFRGPAPQFDISIDYIRIPKIKKDDIVLIADPMVATGSTMLRVLEELEKFGTPKRKMIACVITTNYAIERLEKEHSQVEIYTAAIDPKVDEHGYIIPGLGDAGDRSFSKA